ncbi:MAG TPA: 3-isopropylmalate dehydratase small subunit [Candidatus Acidoferrales bacterium]|nr:3-isopropylmalate dehydratase small subunit [Candidatus Acidoferrales bacterium]
MNRPKGHFTGRTWRFGDNVDTDAIIPGKYLVLNSTADLAKHAFENVRPNFASQVVKGDIIVAGENFGCGSSREHAPLALKDNISIVIARSFARIFFRNAINIGLPVIECDTTEIKDGDILSVDLEQGRIYNETQKNAYAISAYPAFIMRVIKAGGLVAYVKRAQLEGQEPRERKTD